MIKTLWKIYKILRWSKKTFPNYTFEKQIAKVAEEAIEWETEFLRNDVEKELSELTDIIIASINSLRFKETWEMVDEKMKENKKRTWKNGHHVEEKHGKYRT